MSTAPSCHSATPANTRTSALRRLLPLLALLALTTAPRAAIVEEIVAKVNNRIISKSEFEERGNYILRQIYQQYAGADVDARVQEAHETMLANMITELLLVERAQSLLDLDKVRKNLIDDFRKQQNITSDDELEKQLKEQGMTRHDLEEQLIRLAIPNEIINYEVRRKISVSDAEVKQYYDQHLKNWESPASVSFNEIVLFYEEANRPEVMSRAQGVVREARGGTDFGELVQKYSEAGSKETGGFLGPLTAADLHPKISEVVFTIETNGISDPIDTGQSLHVIRLLGRTEKSVKTMDESKDGIVKAVREEKFKPLYERYIRRLWKDGQIDITAKYEQFLVWSPLKAAAGKDEKLPVFAPGAEPEEPEKPAGTPAPGTPAAATPGAAPAPTPSATPAASPSPEPSAEPAASPSPAPSPTPSAAPAPSPSPPGA